MDKISFDTHIKNKGELNNMKKINVLYLAFCIILVGLASGCFGGNKKEPVLNDVMAEMGKSSQLDDMVPLTENDLSDYYGIEIDSVKQFAAKVHGSGIRSDEIVLIEAVDPENAQSIKEKLELRYQSKINENASYNPTELAVVEKCKVNINGNYVDMIISPEVETLSEIYNNSFK